MQIWREFFKVLALTAVLVFLLLTYQFIGVLERYTPSIERAVSVADSYVTHIQNQRGTQDLQVMYDPQSGFVCFHNPSAASCAPAYLGIPPWQVQEVLNQIIQPPQNNTGYYTTLP